MAVNEVIANGETLISLTGDTVTPDTLLEGVTAHDAAGNEIVGTHSGEASDECTASPDQFGSMKLYNRLGIHTDGAVTQKAVTEEIQDINNSRSDTLFDGLFTASASNNVITLEKNPENYEFLVIYVIILWSTNTYIRTSILYPTDLLKNGSDKTNNKSTIFLIPNKFTTSSSVSNEKVWTSLYIYSSGANYLTLSNSGYSITKIIGLNKKKPDKEY